MFIRLFILKQNVCNVCNPNDFYPVYIGFLVEFMWHAISKQMSKFEYLWKKIWIISE